MHRIFSYATLYGAFWATLHRVLTCAMLSQEYQGKTVQDFFMHCCLERLWYYCIRFWPVQNCPKSIKKKLHRIFSYAMLSRAFQATLHVVLTCGMLFKEYQSKIAQDFLCLKPFGHYIGVLPVQCCPVGIKTTLNRIFSYAMLSGATQTTLHRILNCAMLSQEY